MGLHVDTSVVLVVSIFISLSKYYKDHVVFKIILNIIIIHSPVHEHTSRYDVVATYLIHSQA